jgi:tetraacyldisaccharide 4'-kinase
MKRFFEAMFFHPSWYHYPIILLLTPLSLIYGVLMIIRRIFTTRNTFSIPIISVGNLIVGGSGKTPFVIALASQYEGVTIISRGYGRKSEGLMQVSAKGMILTTVNDSGDEPMLIAKALPNASVIVSEDRELAIELAMREGAKLIILDDGFNRVNIKKFEILLAPQSIQNYLPFPAGAFREFWFIEKYADLVLKEGDDFQRVVALEGLTERMVLITAISNPRRLDGYLPSTVVGKMYLDDHAYFDVRMVEQFCKEHEATSIVCTSKDKVKFDEMAVSLPVTEMKLEFTVNDDIMKIINTYIARKTFNA